MTNETRINTEDFEHQGSNFTPEMQEIIKGIHKNHMLNPFYAEGFASGSKDNPYEFDSELGDKVLVISQRRFFSKEDGEELETCRKQLEETPYCAFSYGSYHARAHAFLK
jgi:hypothetical protein